ncbi:MAG: hypothetical protein PHS92_03935 [Candidatus Gracilibacteria bacterium]|nr:hypothetical protein [Candidatus Gracilibacteria bacterium]
MIIINTDDFIEVNKEYVKNNRENIEKVKNLNRKAKEKYQEHREDVEKIEELKGIDINFFEKEY